mgnify:CR=1 FL=1
MVHPLTVERNTLTSQERSTGFVSICHRSICTKNLQPCGRRFECQTERIVSLSPRTITSKEACSGFLVSGSETGSKTNSKCPLAHKEKVFLQLFWNHLHEKLNFRDKTRRIKLFPCALELIQFSRFDPESKENVNRRSELLHRFFGKTKDGKLFFVQIKEEKRSGEKWLVSVFDVDG